MSAWPFPARACSAGHPLRFIPVLLFGSLLASLAPSPSSGLTVADSGRWTPPRTWSGTAVHMALLPGYGSSWHSKIIWWLGLGQNETMYGGLWGWKTGDYDCTSYPNANLDSLGLGLPDSAKVFCSSESHLPSGELFLAGGTQAGTENGARHAYTFDPITNSWAQRDSMSASRPFPKGGRWYPTSTTLADGRQLVTSGSQYSHIEFFSGRVGTDAVPLDSAVFRYGVGYNGADDGAIRTSSTPSLWPSPREGHSAVFDAITYAFGGKTRDGLYTNEIWQLRRNDNILGADYDYGWTPFPPLSGPPAPRSEHTAIAAGSNSAIMIIFGGVVKVPTTTRDSVVSDVWRLWLDVNVWRWTQVTIQTSAESPGPRWGHAAIYHAPSRRMLMFGGRSDTTGAPTDSTLWGLNFSSDFATATWQKLSTVGPSPRFDHAVAFDALWREYTPAGTLTDTTEAFLFGGDLGGGTKANDLWKLHVGPDTTWRRLTLGGTPPSARSGHTLTAIAPTRVLYVFGGVSTDSTVYRAYPDSIPGHLRAWTPQTKFSYTLSNHAALFRLASVFERVPEIYDPAAAANPWTRLTEAPHLQEWYPQSFVWKPDTVFFAGPDLYSYKFSLNSPSWTTFPATSTGFKGGSAVMYRPGKVMKCGARDTGPAADTAITKRIDLNLGASAQWEASAKPMRGRVNHNLVLLPGGKVLVVGGTSVLDNDDAINPVFTPEIWDPDNSGGVGGWFGRDTLAAHLIVRDYHSTALLLPDARVLCAGGNANDTTRKQAEIFCPPYLFKTDGSLATRPGLTGSPQRVRYGAKFSACLSSSDSIASACLIRPAAVTHGFDQSQRYVPLVFTQAWTPARLEVTAPADSFQAPPGDYLLFAVNTQGVPSVARWVRMGFAWAESPPVAPDSIALVEDFITCNAVNLTWVASGDDGTTGTASYTELRRSFSPIVTPAQWENADRITPAPVPVCGGLGQSRLVTGLQPNTNYYFAIKTSDESENLSPIGRLKVRTTSQCGGGERAGIARDDGLSPPSSSANAKPAATATVSALAQPSSAGTTGSGTGTGLLLEATREGGGLDVRLVSIQGESYDGYLFSADGSVLLQSKNDAGEWSTQLHYDLPPGDRFALCTPEQASRWVILAPCAVQQVVTAVQGQRTALNLDAALHCRAGDVTSLLAAGLPPALLPGDTLSLHYAAAGEPDGARSEWILGMERPAAGPTASRAHELKPESSSPSPIAFALQQNLPNPLAASTTIRFALPVASRVRLEIYDLLGRRVRTLADAFYPAGEHEVQWNRRTTKGALASPGLYFYRMDAGQYREKKRMVILP